MINKAVKYGLFLFLVTAFTEITILSLFELLTKNLSFFSLLKFSLFVLAIDISSLIITLIVLNTVPYFRKFLIRERSWQHYQSLTHPLLLKLSIEAPGTYHHSLAVANLSYNAAKAIGADAILTRIGAYYHDIGKAINPGNFIENQKEEKPTIIFENINDLKKGAKNIIVHVQDGLEAAKQYNLPPEISAFIAEHHGTTQTLYFVNEAKKRNANISLDVFTYPGPKPLSRETAIVMLADAIEAKLRLIKDINNLDINNTVNEVIHERLDQKQLELSGLNQLDIQKIHQSFIKTLSTIHHQRINYKK
jgi:hypothetical protein